MLPPTRLLVLWLGHLRGGLDLDFLLNGVLFPQSGSLLLGGLSGSSLGLLGQGCILRLRWFASIGKMLYAAAVSQRSNVPTIVIRAHIPSLAPLIAPQWRAERTRQPGNAARARCGSGEPAAGLRSGELNTIDRHARAEGLRQTAGRPDTFGPAERVTGRRFTSTRD